MLRVLVGFMCIGLGRPVLGMAAILMPLLLQGVIDKDVTTTVSGLVLTITALSCRGGGVRMAAVLGTGFPGPMHMNPTRMWGMVIQWCQGLLMGTDWCGWECVVFCC